MFSATFDGDIGSWPTQLLHDPQAHRGRLAHDDATPNIEQTPALGRRPEHKNALLEHLLTDARPGPGAGLHRAPSATPTRWPTDLRRRPAIEAAALHGDMTQGARNAHAAPSCATASCACWSPPTWPRAASTSTASPTSSTTTCRDAEDYVHRIGRTGRAGPPASRYRSLPPPTAVIFTASSV